MNVTYHPEAKVSGVVFLVGTDEADAIARAQRGTFFHDVTEAVMEREALVGGDDMSIFESVNEFTVIAPKLTTYLS